MSGNSLEDIIGDDRLEKLEDGEGLTGDIIERQDDALE